MSSYKAQQFTEFKIQFLTGQEQKNKMKEIDVSRYGIFKKLFSIVK